MKRARCGAAWSVLSALLMGACAAEPAASARSRADVDSRVASQALVSARQARAEAEALIPPRVTPQLDREHALELLSGPVRSWLGARTARSESASAAYSVVLGKNDAEELTALLELGALWQAFGDQVLSVVTNSVPADFKGEQRSTYLRAVFGATRRPFDEAYSALERCALRAEQTRNESAAAACKERIARLPELVKTPTEPAAAADPAPQSSPESAAPVRPPISSSQPAPCTFAGTLGSNELLLFGDAQINAPLARVWRIDLASLTLGPNEAGAIHVTATWPVQGEYWLAAAALPLVLRSRETLVKDHIWLDAGTPLSAFAPKGGTAEVMRPRAYTAGSEPSFVRRVSCSELALAGSVERAYHAEKNSATFGGALALSAAPDRPPIAHLELAEPTGFEVLAQQGAWRRIAGQAIDQKLPYSFDAWTKGPIIQEGGMGMIGLLDEPKPSHVSTQPLKVFVAPSASAPSLILAPQVWFRAGKPKSGFVSVQVSGLDGPKTKELWVEQSALAKRARAWSPARAAQR